MKRFGIWTPFVFTWICWMIAMILMEAWPVHNHLVRSLVMGGGLLALFVSAGQVRRNRAQNNP